jgi:excisionase family DNA binding protein
MWAVLWEVGGGWWARHPSEEDPVDDVTDPIQVSVPQLLVTPRQAAQALGIGRSTIYELLASGELESVQARRRRSHPPSARWT